MSDAAARAEPSTQPEGGNVSPGERFPGGSDPRIAELSRESAGYRTQRNAAVRRAHAYETMLKAHGVDTSGVTTEALEAIPISGGQADGPFAYTPPKIEVPKADTGGQRAEGKAAPTLDEIRKWPADQINKRWDEVKAAMAAGGKS